MSERNARLTCTICGGPRSYGSAAECRHCYIATREAKKLADLYGAHLRDAVNKAYMAGYSACRAEFSEALFVLQDLIYKKPASKPKPKRQAPPEEKHRE